MATNYSPVMTVYQRQHFSGYWPWLLLFPPTLCSVLTVREALSLILCAHHELLLSGFFGWSSDYSKGTFWRLLLCSSLLSRTCPHTLTQVFLDSSFCLNLEFIIVWTRLLQLRHGLGAPLRQGAELSPRLTSLVLKLTEASVLYDMMSSGLEIAVSFILLALWSHSGSRGLSCLEQ